MTDMLTAHENASIRHFVAQAASEGYLRGRVLDYGCGRQPYRNLVESFGAEYYGYDHDSFPAHIGTTSVGTDPTYTEHFDAILCTQVIQYVPIHRDERYTPDGSIRALLDRWRTALGRDGHLILTYPTNWPEVQPEDLHRFTKSGMERLLAEAGYTVVMHERRATTAVMIDQSAVLALGYGVVARA